MGINDVELNTMKKKLENYRIKEVICADGTSHFYIQEKVKGFFKDTWKNYFYGFVIFNTKDGAENHIKSICEIDTKYHNVEQ